MSFRSVVHSDKVIADGACCPESLLLLKCEASLRTFQLTFEKSPCLDALVFLHCLWFRPICSLFSLDLLFLVRLSLILLSIATTVVNRLRQRIKAITTVKASKVPTVTSAPILGPITDLNSVCQRPQALGCAKVEATGVTSVPRNMDTW